MAETKFDTRGVGPGGVFVMSDADCGPLSADAWREPPLPDDPELRERRLRIKGKLFEAAFGTKEERQTYGRKCLPFVELSPRALELMPPELRASYEAELTSAHDPRSGRVVRPYISRDLAEIAED